MRNSWTQPCGLRSLRCCRRIPMGDIDDIRTDGETILWQGRPAVFPFFAGTILGILLGVPLLFLGRLPLVALAQQSDHQAVVIGYLVLAPVLLTGLALAVVYPIYRVLVYWNVAYAITDRRVLFERGIIESDIDMVDFDQIADASVEVTLFDILAGFGRTGTISLTTRTPLLPTSGNEAAQEHLLSHIAHPHDVFRFFHRTEYDVKADLEYPNAHRPSTNPGYDTHYPPPAQP
jgi:hypothetical protein